MSVTPAIALCSEVASLGDLIYQISVFPAHTEEGKGLAGQHEVTSAPLFALVYK
jgi:hypothetical protein